MEVRTINHLALESLAAQKWRIAQALFFKNAKEFPSHETYNNLGNFLVHEGYTCRNGNVRNATNLGIKYLKRAAEMKTTSINLCAIAKAYTFKLNHTSRKETLVIYQEIAQLLSSAYSITPTKEILYNLLLIQVLLNKHNKTIVDNIKRLVESFLCEESVRLYFEILRFYSLYDEGLHCIAQYRNYLLEDDLLVFYAKHQMYHEGYNLCESVFKQYFPNKYICAAAIECYIKSNHPIEVHRFKMYIAEVLDSVTHIDTDWFENVFSNLENTNEYRRKLILEYISLPPFIDTNYYCI